MNIDFVVGPNTYDDHSGSSRVSTIFLIADLDDLRQSVLNYPQPPICQLPELPVHMKLQRATHREVLIDIREALLCVRGDGASSLDITRHRGSSENISRRTIHYSLIRRIASEFQ